MVLYQYGTVPRAGKNFGMQPNYFPNKKGGGIVVANPDEETTTNHWILPEKKGVRKLQKTATADAKNITGRYPEFQKRNQGAEQEFPLAS